MKNIGIIGRCDSELATPHIFLMAGQAEDLVKLGKLRWIVEGKLARKTYLYDEARRPIERKTGVWIPCPSPAPPADWYGPTRKVLQFQ